MNKYIGFTGLLQLILITLKLAEIGVITTWSWLWVLSPLLAPTFIVTARNIVNFCMCKYEGKTK